METNEVGSIPTADLKAKLLFIADKLEALQKVWDGKIRGQQLALNSFPSNAKEAAGLEAFTEIIQAAENFFESGDAGKYGREARSVAEHPGKLFLLSRLL